jgi:hypothetical protein
MLISPILSGGLGNRLYQLAGALWIADKALSSLVWLDVSASYKAREYKNLMCFKVEDLMENGGHPTKYGLVDVFDLPYGDPVDPKVIITDNNLEAGIEYLRTDARPIVHTAGPFMIAKIAEEVIAKNSFPGWHPNFLPPPIPFTSHVLHLRLHYQHDNFNPEYLRNKRIEGLLANISGEEKRWTVFTNDKSRIPQGIVDRSAHIYGPEIDVYEALRWATDSGVEVLVMSCSTLSAWMAFLGHHKKVWCPREYGPVHGYASCSNRWTFY